MMGITEYTIFDGIAVVMYEDGHKQYMSEQQLMNELYGR